MLVGGTATPNVFNLLQLITYVSYHALSAAAAAACGLLTAAVSSIFVTGRNEIQESLLEALGRKKTHVEKTREKKKHGKKAQPPWVPKTKKKNRCSSSSINLSSSSALAVTDDLARLVHSRPELGG